jgi:hypothetical protein
MEQGKGKKRDVKCRKKIERKRRKDRNGKEGKK